VYSVKVTLPDGTAAPKTYPLPHGQAFAQPLDQSQDAFQLTVEDAATRAYMQRYPFALGPDSAMDARCRQLIHDNLAIRNRVQSAPLIRLKPEQTLLTSEQMARLERIMDESEVPQAERAEMIDDYAWEANLVPLDTKDALVIGCAHGTELMFLRAVLPEANITALDYEDMIPPARMRAIGVRFFQGDLNTLLADFGQEFDLIASNHTLEHLYTPDEILATFAELLRSHGALISTLPMDGMEGSPFLDKVKQAAATKTVHPLDIVYLDTGHPWKTNPADLDATLQEAGFERPQLYQREEHLSRIAACGEKRLKTELVFGKALHTVFFGLPRSFAKIVFSKNPPRFFSRGLLAAERRIWFGSNRLKNRYTQEVLVLARKSSTTA
jgi:SAM-dependent methyltransferase